VLLDVAKVVHNWSSVNRLACRLFHTRSPATAKRLPPKLVHVRVRASVLFEEERRCGRPCSEMSRMSEVRYVDTVEASNWCTRHAILSSTCLWTSSQCSWCNTGVMWSRRRVLVSRWAAAFCTDWVADENYIRLVQPTKLQPKGSLQKQVTRNSTGT